ncbi:MAG: Na+/H+ antiporter subunit E [Rhizobium sp.]|nr:Na+/H+ antiporter subunit E [Rhizobium sp.]
MLPHPLLALSLALMWIVLNGLSLGHALLGAMVGVFASWAMATLRPAEIRFNKWYLIPKLFGVVMYDIVRSNLAVAWVIVRGRSYGHHSQFIDIELELKDPMGLAILAVIVTSTPGSAWLEYDSSRNSVFIHVLDLDDEDQWRDLLKARYEKLLLEIFA